MAENSPLRIDNTEPDFNETYRQWGHPDQRGVLSEHDEKRIREMEAQSGVSDGGKNYAIRKDTTMELRGLHNKDKSTEQAAPEEEDAA